MIYVVLDDLSTFSALNGCVIALLGEKSEETLANTIDFKYVDLESEGNIIIPIQNLVEAYIQVHGSIVSRLQTGLTIQSNRWHKKENK